MMPYDTNLGNDERQNERYILAVLHEDLLFDAEICGKVGEAFDMGFVHFLT